MFLGGIVFAAASLWVFGRRARRFRLVCEANLELLLASRLGQAPDVPPRRSEGELRREELRMGVVFILAVGVGVTLAAIGGESTLALYAAPLVASAVGIILGLRGRRG